MRQEKPEPFLVRLYKKQKRIVRAYSKRRKMYAAEFVRDAIDAYERNYPL